MGHPLPCGTVKCMQDHPEENSLWLWGGEGCGHPKGGSFASPANPGVVLSPGTLWGLAHTV